MNVSGDPESREDLRAVSADIMERISVLVASLRPAIPDQRRPERKSAA
jgi:hypothetical protein